MPGKTVKPQSCNRWVKDPQLNRDFVLHVEKTADMITQNTLFENQQPFNSKWQIIKFVELQSCSCYWDYILDHSCSKDTLHHPKLQTKHNVYSIFDLRHILIPDRALSPCIDDSGLCRAWCKSETKFRFELSYFVSISIMV